MRGFKFLYSAGLALVCLALTPALRADTISGVVKDPSGGVIIGARIEITGGNLVQPLVLASDDSGRFTAPNLEAGKYEVPVGKEEFDDFVTEVDLHATRGLAPRIEITTP